MRRLNILIWPIHGSYLNSLARIEHNWYLPVDEARSEGYGGRGSAFDLPPYVREVPAAEVRSLDLDLIIYQTARNYFEDRRQILSPEQQRLPAIYLEHDSPQPHPTGSRHIIDDPGLLVVHVTHYNRLMWDSGRAPTCVIEHAVAIDPRAGYSGELDRGITVVNSMQHRPRIAGYDIFQWLREEIPLDIAGMETEAFGGLGDIPYRDLHRRVGHYRFLFSPIRYTSLPLAVIEGLTLGMPVIALATTELPTVIQNGVHGFVSCDLEELVCHMKRLLAEPDEAYTLGANARQLARQRFGIDRFTRDWNEAFALVRSWQADPAHLQPASHARTGWP